ncbi:hypothetical protein HO173_006663 [Letharia columbiana]|uniref:Uncharacterized protein n=1 Tax=Letharia columbiana TaxID=112416 RepID=A0A8H6FUR2_9LECA|nr:uncharacterized protein HO173_006663 [Letharia columbiana]KAF6235036.1 hypothetical protein HO173_006663 [Letharia columbiana]
MPRSRSLRPVSAASELSVEEGYGLVDGDDMCGRKWVRQQGAVNEPSGGTIKIAATKLSVDVAKAIRDFASSKDKKSLVPETRSGHSQVQIDAESDWQPRQHAFTAINTLATPNLHTVKSTKAEGKCGGSLIAFEGLHSKETDKVKAPKYRSSFAHRAANKDRRMANETGSRRNHGAHRNSQAKDEDSKTRVSLGKQNEG